MYHSFYIVYKIIIILQEVSKENYEKSTIMSPFSVLYPLALLCLYSNGQARTELLNVLKLKNDNQVSIYV